MKFQKLLSSITIMMVVVLFSCQSEEGKINNEISQDAIDQISAMGFGTSNLQRVDGGYLVEGDIFLPASSLNQKFEGENVLRVANSEQYRTTNLVTGLPRVITVSVDSKLSSSYVAAVDEAIARYNAQNLQLTFQRVSSGATIKIVKGSGNFLASAGFPSGGNPFGTVKVNTSAIGNQPLGTVASIIAHEIGHCIGFRHTDYMDRSYSGCAGGGNEGASTVGAIHIPGTPTGPDANSWMLACIGSGMNRPFNANDRTALNYLY